MRHRTTAIVILAIAAIAALAILGPQLKEPLVYLFTLLREAGPAVYFLSMAILPAVGVPLSFFTLTAGAGVGPPIGMPAVLALSLGAVGANIALSYVLARRAFRPPLEYVVRRLGYSIPAARPDDTTDLVVLLRVTPGIPFPVQNYLLGFAAVPFLPYLLISCLIALPLNGAIIVFGEALLQGRGRAALVGLLALVAVMAAISLVRRRISRKVPGPPTASRNARHP
jgi:uncharacterized membrane protein YdjX (TVP38/TMEM64 family)